MCVSIGASELACLSEWVLSDMRPARSACRNLPAAEDPCITVLRRPYTKLMTTGYVGQGRHARRDLGGQWTAGGWRLEEAGGRVAAEQNKQMSAKK